ncbi:O-antigen ligase family protein [Streptomyces sp. NPDC007901]|uniref:O-antigen ligase family protein n=1 Tax=Streptomyces sp. NPDC007901 TaxID=3364785 RepID=UPI0036F15510
MIGQTELLFFSVLAVVCSAVTILLALCFRGSARLLWGACLVPLFLLGRAYATVGFPPVYLMDLLAVLALLVTAGAWGPRLVSEPRLRGFRMVAFLLAAFTAQAVYRGVAAGYPDPLKGVILGVYPMFGLCATTWLLTRPERELTRCRWVLYMPALGALVSMATGLPTIVAATGLYLAIAGAFAVSLHRRGDSRLLFWTVAGTGVITALASKRGPFLAVVAAMVATAVADRAGRRSASRRSALSWGIATTAVAAVVAFTLSGHRLVEAPVVGGLTTRAASGWQTSGSEAANNVGIRFALWEEALGESLEHPLIGAGTGHPLELVFEGRPRHEPKAGPHNSFVGYLYYLGWPAGLGFILLTAATLRRTWRARHHRFAACWFGATVGVCVIAFTNVTFETTYMGLPSWLVLSCAYGLVGVPRGDEGETGPATRAAAASPLSGVSSRAAEPAGARPAPLPHRRRAFPPDISPAPYKHTAAFPSRH